MTPKENKAVFLDRDGTINVERHYVHSIEDFELLPGVIEGLKMIQQAGYLLVVVTNQSGIARGYYSEKDFFILNNYMKDLLKSKGVCITDVFFCPHLPDAAVERYRCECNCRKPKTGLYYEAIEKWNISLDKSWAIGDRERDLAICMDTRCRGILLTGKNNDSYLTARDMVEAAKIILSTEC